MVIMEAADYHGVKETLEDLYRIQADTDQGCRALRVYAEFSLRARRSVIREPRE